MEKLTKFERKSCYRSVFRCNKVWDFDGESKIENFLGKISVCYKYTTLIKKEDLKLPIPVHPLFAGLMDGSSLVYNLIHRLFCLSSSNPNAKVLFSPYLSASLSIDIGLSYFLISTIVSLISYRADQNQ